MDKIPRMADPKWLEACRLWDRISELDRSIVVKAMEYMVEQRKEEERSGGLGGGEGGGGGQGGEG